MNLEMAMKAATKSDIFPPDNDYRALRKRINVLHEFGVKVAFTNGAYDILGAHHIRFLRWIKENTDNAHLIVAVNSDESVRQLKGSARPIMPLNERLEIISELWSVDTVTWFSEETPLRLLENITVDYLIKGGDRTDDKLVGEDLVKSLGGIVLRSPVFGGHSTDIINKILRGASHA